ncbi:MAG: response regulator [Alphaproteobacteria bacterium]
MADLCVLIVDDNVGAINLLKMVLNRIGVGKVLDATDAKQAFATLERGVEPVDIVMCDWRMPEVSGLHFLRRVRERHAQLPFVMVTAKSDVDSILRAKEFGVTDFIAKPYNAKTILTKVTKLAKTIETARPAVRASMPASPADYASELIELTVAPRPAAA